MEDLDIIRHDMQPGLQSPVDGRAAEPGRRPGCRALSTAGLPAENRGRAARESRPRDLPRKSAADFRDLPRVHGRASKPAAGLQSIINKIINC